MTLSKTPDPRLVAELEALVEFLRSPEPAGPKYDDASLLMKFEEVAQKGGRRRSIVEGQQLVWYNGRAALRKRLISEIEQCPESILALKQRLESAWELTRNNSPRGFVPKPISRETSEATGEVPGGHLRPQMPQGFSISRIRGEGQSGVVEYSVGMEWARYYWRLRDAENALRTLPEHCPRAGRVLAVEEMNGPPSLIAPKTWVVRKLLVEDQGLSFVLTRDLPSEWLTGPESLPLRKRRAGQWMARVADHFRSQGRRPTADQLRRHAKLRFGLRDAHVKEIWSSVRGEIELPSGNVAKKMRVEDNEIKAIE